MPRPPRNDTPPNRRPRPKPSTPPPTSRKPKNKKILPINVQTTSATRRSTQILMTILGAILFLFVGTHIFGIIRTALTPSIPTEVIRISNSDIHRGVPAMIIRHEEVVYAPREGRLAWEINQTDRVRRDTLIARVQDSYAAERITQNLMSVEEDIRRLSDLRHFSEADTVVQRTDANIHNTVAGTMHNFTTQNLSELNSLNERLNQLTASRNQMIINDSLGAVGQAGRSHEQLTYQMHMNSTNIHAPRSGIMFTILDGHETQVTPENMRDLTHAQVNYYVDHNAVIPARDVEAGDPIFKLVDNVWYIATYMPSDMTEGFVQGTYRTIFASNDVTGEYESLFVRIYHLNQMGSETFVIFRATRNVLEFLNQRNTNVRITNQIHTGFQVSNSAIVSRRYIAIPRSHVHGQGIPTVHLRADYGLEPIGINIVRQTEQHVYVLEEGSGLIMGDNLLAIALEAEGHVITESSIHTEYGVYRATFGYASFVSIHLDHDLTTTDGYVMLDATRNRSLREFDVIVTDASQVTQNQLLR